MNPILLGNIVCFIGSMIMISTGLIKKKNRILYVQCIQLGIMGTGNLILGGITGGIANIIGITRNLFSIRFKFNWVWKIIFIAVQSVFSLAFNQSGAMGWFPVIACCVFTIFLDTTDERILKGAIIIAQSLWAFYDAYILNFSACVFDILTVGSNIIGIISITRSLKAKKEEQNT